MKRAFVDTSAWLAYVNRDDPDHGDVTNALKGWRGRLVTSNFIFDETVTLCIYRWRHDVAVAMGDAMIGGRIAELVSITGPDEETAWHLQKQRKDKKYSFTDCTSFALMRRLGIDTAVALDDDFRAEGFAVIP